MVLFAEFGFVPRRHMFLLLQLEVAVGEGTGILEFAATVKFPVATHLD